PPCVDALLPLRLARAVIAMPDPNPRVRGRGIVHLRRAGVPVTVGPGREEAQRLTAGYASRVIRGRPLVTLQLARTLERRPVAAPGGAARGSPARAARRLAHGLGDVTAGVLVGAGTVRADDPRLPCRLRGGRAPIPIVVAGPALALPPRARVVALRTPATWVIAPRNASPRRGAPLPPRGAAGMLLPGRPRPRPLPPARGPAR